MSENPVLPGRHGVRQIAEVLRTEIEEGRWERGRVLTQAALARRHRAPAHIVAAAIGLLQEEGLVESRRRIGTRPKVEGQSWDAPGGIPQTRHIERTVRQRIADGSYPLKERVPLVADFATEFGVSSSVVSSALQPLKHDGLLTQIPFRGLFVTARQPHIPVASKQTS